ncbi:hypothetical protein OGATHE_000871 [Ogataea polymorpha]|uniref:Uncharacterized protein n=1 Tax=Ogataea polymorpha TaxID=460523 RepID=A0A9P8PTN6_9ASCO|nr:hypothetical protein OGATHE_000871 [Ogataea polymorpha]
MNAFPVSVTMLNTHCLFSPTPEDDQRASITLVVVGSCNWPTHISSSVQTVSSRAFGSSEIEPANLVKVKTSDISEISSDVLGLRMKNSLRKGSEMYPSVDQQIRSPEAPWQRDKTKSSSIDKINRKQMSAPKKLAPNYSEFCISKLCRPFGFFNKPM